MRIMRASRNGFLLAAGLLAVRLAAQQPALPTPEQFFRIAGAGLRSAEEEQSSYWQPHIENSHRRILEAADMCERHRTALVLGAGKCTEIPLEDLARRFDEVVLVDLDEESMAAAVEELPDELIPKVHVSVQDVTTFAAPLMGHLLESVAESDSAATAFGRIAQTLDKLEPRKSPFRLPEADLVVSSLLLSELHRYPLNYADRLVRDKFGTRLATWTDYDGFRARLEQVALKDHVGLLAGSCRRGGIVYFADTVMRGPLYEKIGPERRREVLLGMLPSLNQHGLISELRQQEPLRDTFAAAFGKIHGRWDGEKPASGEEIAELLAKLAESSESVAEADRGAACETSVNLLCRERFPVSAEVATLEDLLDLHASGPEGGFETLVPLDALQNEWRNRGLAPQGADEHWWWLAYPCSVSYSSGAFQIRSWILKPGGK